MAKDGIRARLKLDDDGRRKEWDDRIAVAVGVFAAVIILGAMIMGGAMLVRMWHYPLIPTTNNPLKSIFASRLMVATARLALLFVGVYLVVSVLVHMRRGQWLTGVGPFKIADAASKIDANVAKQDVRMDVAQAEVDRLRSNLADLTGQLRTAENLLERAQRQLRERDT